jgi:hypothetical protein
MAIKKILPQFSFILIFFSLLSFTPLSAEWRSDIAKYFGDKKDYEGAISYLLGQFDKIDGTDKPMACIILAYCYNKLNDKNNENKWTFEFFETYNGIELPLSFLDDSTNWSITNFLYAWKKRYPFVFQMALVTNNIQSDSPPPPQLPLGLDITNDALYKLSDQKYALKGGLLKAGFNIIPIDTRNFFEDSGLHLYFLELKTGDLILKKEIEISVEVESPRAARDTKTKTENKEYKLSMFVGGEMVVSTKKSLIDAMAKAEIVPKNAVAYDPSIYVDKNKPGRTSGVSILSAAALAYEALKQLMKKKEEKKPEYKIQRQQELTTFFKMKDMDGVEEEIKTTIRLKIRNLPLSATPAH